MHNRQIIKLTSNYPHRPILLQQYDVIFETTFTYIFWTPLITITKVFLETVKNSRRTNLPILSASQPPRKAPIIPPGINSAVVNDHVNVIDDSEKLPKRLR